jgi:hypothetical protein
MSMFEKLKKKWGVSQTGLILILCTFALGGSLCGYLAKKILVLFELPSGTGKVFVYIILVTLLWPISVITLSLFTGQFTFFKTYLGNIYRRMTGKK